MFSDNNKISVWQLKVLLIVDVFGTGVIILPRKAAEFASQDGWISIIVATLIATVFGYVITTLGRMFPDKAFYTYSKEIVGRPIAFLLSLGLTVKIIVGAAVELRFFGEIVKQTLLADTPYCVVASAIVLTGAYAAAKGYETRARIGEILIFIVLIPIVTVFVIGAFGVDITNVMPILEASPRDIFTGGFYCTTAFAGLELIMLVNPYVNKPRKIRRAVLCTIPVIGLLMLFITFVTICEFGAADVKRQMWPVLEMMDVTNLPGAFIERQSAFVMSFWIVSVFAIINAALFFASVMLRDMLAPIFKDTGHTVYIIICALIVLLLSFAPRDIMQAARIFDFLFITFGMAYFMVIPLLLLLTAKARGLGKS